MTLMLFNVVGGRVVEPTVPMMLFHCGGRWWVGNTASRIALLRRNGAAITSHVISPRVCHRVVHNYAGVGRCSATPRKAVRLCAGK